MSAAVQLLVHPRRLAGAPWLTCAATQTVFRVLRNAGWDARAVGGVVRDALLGRAVADVDFATPATPDVVIAACKAAGLTCIDTGIEHGTVTVVVDGRSFEVTTLRRDVETDGRHAIVAFTDDWTLDARRRDFTINALYCDADGTVFDPLGGYGDVVARQVRFIGSADVRIAEDQLRILRFFRFHAELGSGPVDRVGAGACARGRDGLDRLSRERVRHELLRLLVAERANDAVAALIDYGLLAGLIGSVPRPGVLRALITAEATARQPADAMLRLSALAVGVEEDMARLAERLRLSRAETAALLVVDDRLATTFAGLDASAARRCLYRIGPARWRRSCLAAAALARTQSERSAALAMFALPASWSIPVLPVRGADVLARGVAPGPEVGAILAQVESWWLANDFPAEADVRRHLNDVIDSRQCG